jgi:hypothetical protein
VSNTRRVKLRPRPPDATERAFAAELRRGCPWCHSRKVTAKFKGHVWNYGLMCLASYRTFAEPLLAHRLGAQAAERAGAALGERLQYQAFDTSAGRIEGAVRALAGR